MIFAYGTRVLDDAPNHFLIFAEYRISSVDDVGVYELPNTLLSREVQLEKRAKIEKTLRDQKVRSFAEQIGTGRGIPEE